MKKSKLSILFLAASRILHPVSVSLFLLASCILYPVSVFCAFKENIWTARTAGLGGAFSSVSNDVSAVIFNPAGLSQIERADANFTYTQKYIGLPNVKVGNAIALFGYPVEKIGAFGVGYLSSDVSGLYTEQSIILTYSSPLHKILGTKIVKVGKKTKEFPVLELPIYLGLNLKFLTLGYNLDERTKTLKDPVFADATSKSGLAADFGVMVKPLEKISTSLVVKNLLTPDLGLKTSETVPREFLLGGALKVGDFKFFEDFTISLDLSNRIPQKGTQEFNYRLGLESWFDYHRYAARLGFNDTGISLGGGIIQTIASVDVQIDYAFVLPLYLADNIGSHRLSLTTRF